MYEEEIHFGKLLLKHLVFGPFDHSDLDFWPSDLKVIRIHMLPTMDVWTRYEEGRSRRSQVIDKFWHIWPQWPL